MKTIAKYCALVAVGLAGASSLNAQTIYSDSFTGTAASAINGRTPDLVDLTSDTWTSVPTNFVIDSTGSMGSLSANQTNTNNGAGPSLSFTPAANSIYRLSFDVIAIGGTGSGNWLSLSFVGTDDGSTWFNDGRASILIKGDNNIDTYYGNTGTGAVGTFGALANVQSFTGTAGAGTYSLTLNTGTGALDYAKNGIVFRSVVLSSTDISAIGGIAIGAGQGTTTATRFDNFSLVAVPEPSSTAAVILSGLGLLLVARRRRMRAL